MANSTHLPQTLPEAWARIRVLEAQLNAARTKLGHAGLGGVDVLIRETDGTTRAFPTTAAAATHLRTTGPTLAKRIRAAMGRGVQPPFPVDELVGPRQSPNAVCYYGTWYHSLKLLRATIGARAFNRWVLTQQESRRREQGKLP
jgi:hypothetical protein